MYLYGNYYLNKPIDEQMWWGIVGKLMKEVNITSLLFVLVCMLVVCVCVPIMVELHDD